MTTEHQSRKSARRGFLKAGIALATTLAAERAGVFSHPLLTPEFVHAQAGLTREIKDAGGKAIGVWMSHAGNGADLGFTIEDNGNGGGKVYSAFKRLGGETVLGYPVSHVFFKEGVGWCQALQGGVLQVNPKEGSPDGVVLLNSLDVLRDIEKNTPNVAALLRSRGIPSHKEGGFSPAERLQWMDPARYPTEKQKTAARAIQSRFNEQGPSIFGYPTSELVDLGLFSAIRGQRVAFQYWQEELPDHPELPRKGSVTLFLAGDLLKEFGWIPEGEKYITPVKFATGGGEQLTEPWTAYGAPTLAERPVNRLVMQSLLQDERFGNLGRNYFSTRFPRGMQPGEWDLLIRNMFVEMNIRKDTSELRGGIFGSEKFISRLQNEVLPTYRRRDIAGYSEFIREVDYIIEIFGTDILASSGGSSRAIFLHFAAASPPFTEEQFPGENMLRPILSIAHEQRHVVDAVTGRLLGPTLATEASAVHAAIETAKRMNWAENYVVRTDEKMLIQMKTNPNFIPWWSPYTLIPADREWQNSLTSP